jgi:selenocysteine-specific elongation factor
VRERKLELDDRVTDAEPRRAVPFDVVGPESTNRDVAAGEEGLERAGGWLFAPEWLDELRRDVHARLAARAESEPLDPGLALAELLPAAAWATAVAPRLGLETHAGKLQLPGVAASLAGREAAAAEIERSVAEAGLNPVRVDDRRLADFLEQQGKLVRVGDGLAVGAEAYAAARRALVEECESAGRITLARFRDLTGGSRRTAQLLLERFDADGLTRRIGDERVLRRAARP